MPDLDHIATVLAYQKSNLLSIRRLFDTLHYDLSALIAHEERLREEIPTLVEKLVELSEAIESGKIPDHFVAEGDRFPSREGQGVGNEVTEKQGRLLSTPTPSQEGNFYTRADAYLPKHFRDLIHHAEKYLQEHHIQLSSDPLVQVLDAPEILTIAETYRRKYGNIGWNRADYTAVTLAGCIGTLLDLLLVKLPLNPNLLNTLPQGYALTTWLQRTLPRLRKDYVEPLTQLTDAYRSDPSVSAADAEKHGDSAVSEQEKKPDTLFAFILALLDLVRRTGTHVDRHGNIVTADRLTTASEHDPTLIFMTALRRLVTDVFRSAGIESPFGSLNHADLLSRADLSVYLHAHGYNPGEFLLMGIIPATIDLIVKGYWLLAHFDHQEDLHRADVKLTSMLLFSHSLTLSGNLVKSGILFQINPLSLNWEHILRFCGLMVAWINEGVERENAIRAALDDEWLRMYQQFKK